MADLAVYLSRSAACLAVFYALYWLALRKETCFALNRAFLLAGAALSLGLPLLRVPSPFFRTVIDASALRAPAGPSGAAAAPGGTVPLEIMAAIYVAGAALLLLLFAIRLGRLAILASRCGCVRRRGLRVVFCGHPGESFSFFRFVFLDASKIPPEDMDRVLAHEMAHVRQLHSLDVVFSEVLAALQWFNPFVWPYKRSLRETHEYLADRAVIAQGCGLARYQLLIVEQHVGGRLLELASGFRTSQIKRRIVMLSRQQTKGLARWKPFLILPAAVALVLAFAESKTIVRGDTAQAAAQSVQENKAAGAGQKTLSEEDAAKALREKMVKLEDLKKQNEEIMAKLKAKLAAAPDAATREKILAEIKDRKAKGIDIGAAERELQIKKIELALSKETDAARKAALEKKLEQVKAESREDMKKVEAAGEKKAEKK